MKDFFTLFDYKTMLQLNIASIIVTGICEGFAILLLLTKGMDAEIEPWKYKVMIAAVAAITILFLISIIWLVLFLRMKKK